ncbi:metal ABC transporter solute-binding protein, Zn/Mn family [Pseudomonas sp. JBR1]|uniref:metal ABC transporter solute-binding protein, Zn/Mn family n=1 Tax=Pseudomonas sp. JBR1 TaxID=3020907 RepID=UPI0023058FED|nr:zinc ABC transporter substrate-binding protein [Pseudomonas sp. JBR1]WCE09038.1 zinc ABC transporter substrate-binding protein [Pseudomonas sp. JBR1]
MQSLASALNRLGGQPFAQAAAVVTLSSLWQADPLYASARRHNLRIVEVDASRAWDPHQPALALLRVPANDVPWARATTSEPGHSPFVWLGPVNGLRLATLIAADLARLSPEDAPRITTNLRQFEADVRNLKAEYGARTVALNDARVLALANEFTYLFDDFGLYVEGWFVRQDVDWSETDRSALTQYLRERDIQVVVHKWTPSAPIAEAIRAAGARLVVLDVGNPGLFADPTVRYETFLRSNLDRLLAAFDVPANGVAAKPGQLPAPTQP